MTRRRLRTIGVLGGMGPEATAAFFERLVRAVAALRDQDHPPVLVLSLPQVPDRTAALLHGGPSPVPAILRGLRTLKAAGADLAVIPCVSAHAFWPAISARSPLPLIHLLEAALDEVMALRPRPSAIGLLATTGTVRTGTVARLFGPAGIRVIVPSDREQTRVMAAIYGPDGIKAGHLDGPARRTLLAAARALIQSGAEAIMAGCTEVPLVMRPSDLRVPLIDPMAAAARVAVRRAGARLRRR